MQSLENDHGDIVLIVERTAPAGSDPARFLSARMSEVRTPLSEPAGQQA
jgi:hypothetical protein